MTYFLSLADHFGSAIHSIGLLLAGISVGFIVGESLRRTYVQFIVKPRNAQLFQAGAEITIIDANRTRVL